MWQTIIKYFSSKKHMIRVQEVAGLTFNELEYEKVNCSKLRL